MYMRDEYIILACSSLADYVRAAQIKLGTDYPVIYLDKTLHLYPEKMRASIQEKLNSIDDKYTYVLVAMGYCGGSWQDIVCHKKIVMPKVDDCVTLLLHTEEQKGYNLKEKDWLYMKDKNPSNFDIERTFEAYTKNMEADEKEKIAKSWRSIYSTITIVDTGLNDCKSEDYKKVAQKNAKWLGGKVIYTKGSNILIEKLVAGDWDEDLFEIY